MIKEYFIKCPKHPGVTTMIGTSDENYQMEIETHIINYKVKDDIITAGGKPRTISTLSKKFEGSVDTSENGRDLISNGK